jgi:hypothetical protein
MTGKPGHAAAGHGTISQCTAKSSVPPSLHKESTMAITAVFSVDDINAATGDARTVNLSAVEAGDGDNTSWSVDTFPAGELAMTVNQTKVLDFFQAGKKYRITIQAL